MLVPQDECIVNVNEGPRRHWLKGDQQPLKKKGNGCAIHICGWVCEATGHLRLSDEQVAAQSELPEVQQLKVTDSCKIIYPGKNHNGWWDLKQYIDHVSHLIHKLFQVPPAVVILSQINNFV